MSFAVLRLNAQDAALGWEKAGAYLLPAIAQCAGLYEPEDVLARVTDPESGWLLWVAVDEDRKMPVGAWTTQVKNFPRARVMEVAFGGGTDLKGWYALGWEHLAAYARECGCDRVRCAGRNGWARMGFSQAAAVFDRKLT